MSWINSISPVQWLIIGAIPIAIILLYFLKLRRNPLEVPSTILWKRTVEDLNVNSLWQTLRRNLLLFLQLLLILFLVAALLRPGCDGTELEGDRFILVIDNSASMSATDVAPSRLEDAKDRALDIIRAMEPTDVAMIISCSDQATIIQSYTSDQELLKKKIALVKPTHRRSDISEALNAASALANPGRSADKDSEAQVQVADPRSAMLYIFSDGNIDHELDFSLGYLTPKYVPIGAPESANVGITDFSLSVERGQGTRVNAFARIANDSSNDATVELALYVEDVLVDANTSAKISSGAQNTFVFDLTEALINADRDTSIELRIVTRSNDDLDIDNRAFAVYRPPRPIEVLLVTDENIYLQEALGTKQIERFARVTTQATSFLDSKTYQSSVSNSEYDLIIFDRCQPAGAPLANTVSIGVLPTGDDWTASELQYPVSVIDTARVHPVMRDIQMNRVLIVEARSLEGPFGTASLCDSGFGSIIAIGPRQEFEDVVLGFAIIEADEQGNLLDSTDWPGPKHSSFPRFWQNIVSYFARGTSGSGDQLLRPGDSVPLVIPRFAKTVEISTPINEPHSLNRQEDIKTVFHQTAQVGVYEVAESESGELLQKFAVNLADSRESKITPVEKIEIGYEEFEGSSEEIETRKEFWIWLIVTAIAVLFVEWIVFNRRVFV